MPALRRRLTRLEHSVGELLPDQQHCPFCHGRKLLAFSDEPDNVGSRLPYDRPNGTCRLCRLPPPGTDIVRLPAAVAEYFARLPWSDDGRHRFIEKLMLLKAIAKRDTEDMARIVTRLLENDANGMRHWRWPAIKGSSDDAAGRTNDVEKQPAT